MTAVPHTFDELPIYSKLESEQLLDPKFWDDPLSKFAKATGLTVSLWSPNGKLMSGPHAFSPLGQCLLDADFWCEDRFGFGFEKEMIQKVFSHQKRESAVALHTLGVSAEPVLLGSKVIGVFIVGWLPEDFSNPVASDAIAKVVGVKSLDLWQIVRMQQPMTREKRFHYCQMLESLGSALALRIEKQFADWRQAQILRVLHESSVELTGADSIESICQITLEATKKLVSASHILVHINSLRGESEAHVCYLDDAPPDEKSPGVSSEVRLEVSIASSNKKNLGIIEIRSPQSRGTLAFIPPEIEALASQVAVTIQKIRVHNDLLDERSALEQANTQLQKMSRLKDEFLATLSHELRTPMNSILGWAQLLREQALSAAEIPDAMAVIERNARIQSRLIEDLLDVSRIISGKMLLNRDSFDAVLVMKSALETVRPVADAKKIKIFTHLPEEPIFLVGDAGRMQQVFWNLLSNAVKFSPVSGEVTVLMKPAGAYFHVEVIDRGQGISPEFLPHIFDRFSQADGSHARSHGGLGLGLAIVRHIVELHGGTVSALSDGKGQGSKFSLLLPADSAHAKARGDKSEIAAAEASDGEKRSLDGLTVLAVDDEPDSLQLIRFVLERNGAVVITAESASEGLAALKANRPDLIVSDLSMPKENGFQLIRRIRELAPDQGGLTPAFALSALTSESEKAQALDSGFQFHFSKPLNPSKIVEAMAGIRKIH